MHDCRLLRGVLRSSRPANIPTLFTNAAAAWASVRGAELPPLALYGGVVLMGLCFYLYGMWENDRVAAWWDAARYPDRPVPCGAVSVSVLRLLSLAAGLSGLVLNMALGGEFAVGALLLIVISLYNVFHKLWSGSIVLMGLCRGVWVLAAVTIGGGVLGVGGMLLAVPLAAAAYQMLREDVRRRNLPAEEPPETEP